jgi:hypothetical protein
LLTSFIRKHNATYSLSLAVGSIVKFPSVKLDTLLKLSINISLILFSGLTTNSSNSEVSVIGICPYIKLGIVYEA